MDTTPNVYINPTIGTAALHVDVLRADGKREVLTSQTLGGQNLMGYFSYFLKQAGMDPSDSFSLSMGQYALGMVENGLLTWARLILLDSPLVAVTAFTVLAFPCITEVGANNEQLRDVDITESNKKWQHPWPRFARGVPQPPSVASTQGTPGANAAPIPAVQPLPVIYNPLANGYMDQRHSASSCAQLTTKFTLNYSLGSLFAGPSFEAVKLWDFSLGRIEPVTKISFAWTLAKLRAALHFGGENSVNVPIRLTGYCRWTLTPVVGWARTRDGQHAKGIWDSMDGKDVLQPQSGFCWICAVIPSCLACISFMALMDCLGDERWRRRGGEWGWMGLGRGNLTPSPAPRLPSLLAIALSPQQLAHGNYGRLHSTKLIPIDFVLAAKSHNTISDNLYQKMLASYCAYRYLRPSVRPLVGVWLWLDADPPFDALKLVLIVHKAKDEMVVVRVGSISMIPPVLT
ncbi:hypothetical protein NM208_g3697 [Fusarium decemcellulare]|uniref:Uncharacterized protein n=1 Tax=Fusarium decemcellulare TaxID=57161 RepID=A0ACC1SN45_9HYPO|nr:hypothetical protein NM208_g3697 [Fusarium decemcellulare]